MTAADPAAVQVRPAATVMLVRDAPSGPEVMMVRRHPANVFVGGAHVFPGGAVDPADRIGPGGPVDRLPDLEASVRLGVEGGGLAYWVAAIRECFEEVGVLLAYDDDGTMLRLDDPVRRGRFAEHRAALDAGRRTLTEICTAEGLSLAVDALHYFSHWVTPVGPPRRYDTRFFLARAPEGQDARHDDRETVDVTWLRPADALELAAAGRIDVIQPTARTLEALVRFDDVDEMLGAATATAAAPDLVHEDGGVRIRLPGDPDLDRGLDAPTPTHGDLA
ncbi:NUDIX hydrolase [Actinomarinicola tropica]|uniref:NUDIX hydrolase n=1 Tax=Actinomarinicola tropica TaxID=2789776 RepID=A0A5Q2RQY1_9ACTN|nr:NUDIX domain-containing protein [Actinomarinicola tropica]QGG96547.1 NUDIX hydrolase [Actinomarinicola tropica]